MWRPENYCHSLCVVVFSVLLTKSLTLLLHTYHDSCHLKWVVAWRWRTCLALIWNNNFDFWINALIYIGSEMNFHFIWYLWNELCVFISPSLWPGDIKHTTSFINTVWNENLFQILFIFAKMQEKYCFIEFYLRKMRQRRGVTYVVIDELRRLSLSKCFPALCHKLIYEITIFHSINREMWKINLWNYKYSLP